MATGVDGMGLSQWENGYWSNLLSRLAMSWSGMRQGIMHGLACNGIFQKVFLATNLRAVVAWEMNNLPRRVAVLLLK